MEEGEEYGWMVYLQFISFRTAYRPKTHDMPDESLFLARSVMSIAHDMARCWLHIPNVERGKHMLHWGVQVSLLSRDVFC